MNEPMSDARLVEIQAAADQYRGSPSVRRKPNSAIAHRGELLNEVQRLRTPMSDERLAQIAACSPFPFEHPATQVVYDALQDLLIEAMRARAELAELPRITDGITGDEAYASAEFDLTIDEIRSFKARAEAAEKALAELCEQIGEPADLDDVFEPGHTYRSENGYFEFRCERRIGEHALGIETVLKDWPVRSGTRFWKWASIGPSVGYIDVTEQHQDGGDRD